MLTVSPYCKPFRSFNVLRGSDEQNQLVISLYVKLKD